MEVLPGEGTTGEQAFRLVGLTPTFRVLPNGGTQNVVQITAYSDLHGVTFTWFITEATWKGGGAHTAAAEKTAEVNAIAGHAHVQAFRTEQEQDRSGLLGNYAVITVGTADLASTTDVVVRMDHLALPSTFDAIDAAWTRLEQLGAGAGAPLA